MKTFPRKSTIEIDCDPWHGMGRQENYYLAICKMINTEPQPRISAFFGCWEQEITYNSQEDENKVEKYLKDLYNRHIIRYASW